MPKGHKRELNLSAGLIESDRSLLYSVRRNIDLAEQLLRLPIGEGEKSELEVYFGRHPLNKPKSVEPVEAPASRILTGRERLSERLIRMLAALSESNLNHLYELAKSMGRMEKPARSENARKKPTREKAAGKSDESAISADGVGGKLDASTSRED